MIRSKLSDLTLSYEITLFELSYETKSDLAPVSESSGLTLSYETKSVFCSLRSRVSSAFGDGFSRK